MDRLIEAVKDTPCLWDTNNPAYKDYEIMERAWSQVAEDLCYPDGKYAKVQWKKLRDNFREALKRQSDHQKRSKRTVKEWRFKQQMEFLIPYMQSRGLDFTSSFNDSVTDESCDLVQNTDLLRIPVVVQLTESQNSSNMPQNFVKVHQDLEADTKANDLQISEVFHSSEVPQTSNDKRQRTLEWVEDGVEPDDSFQGKRRENKNSLSILSDAKVAKQSNCIGLKKGDALLSFFSSMYNTTSQLSPQMQLQVKRKIFEIVAEAEESSFMVKQEREEYDEQCF